VWRKACPWFTGVLAVAVTLTAWRLKEVQVELERMRDQVAAGRTVSPEPGSAEPAAAADRASAARAEETPAVAGAASDMSAEWEQAVPPMDS